MLNMKLTILYYLDISTAMCHRHYDIEIQNKVTYPNNTHHSFEIQYTKL